MRLGKWLVVLALLVVVAGAFSGGYFPGLGLRSVAVAEESAKPAGPPPLKIDKGAPLLLDEPPAKETAPPDPLAGPVADNTACHVCHANYKDEEFAVVHAKADVGCVKCHGDSLPHRNDENNITPPDKMYPIDRIEANCRDCHETHDAPAAKVITRWRERCAAKTDPTELLCTDCHGEHRLKVRNVSWDKKTRELIGGGGKMLKAAASQ